MQLQYLANFYPFFLTHLFWLLHCLNAHLLQIIHRWSLTEGMTEFRILVFSSFSREKNTIEDVLYTFWIQMHKSPDKNRIIIIINQIVSRHDYFFFSFHFSIYIWTKRLKSRVLILYKIVLEYPLVLLSEWLFEDCLEFVSAFCSVNFETHS